MTWIAIAAALAALLCFGAPAATIYTEVEPNDTWATANLIPAHDGTITIYGSRVGDSSADYFRFPAVAGDVLTGTVCCLGDPMLALFDPAGTLVTYNDDYYGLMPFIAYPISVSGLWTIAVTGYPDFSWDGGGSSGWTYTATITLQTPAGAEIPEPGTSFLIAAGLAGVAVLRCRRC